MMIICVKINTQHQWLIEMRLIIAPFEQNQCGILTAKHFC